MAENTDWTPRLDERVTIKSSGERSIVRTVWPEERRALLRGFLCSHRFDELEPAATAEELFVLDLLEAADARGTTDLGLARAALKLRARDTQQHAAGVDIERERVKALINTMGAKTGGYISIADFYAAVRDGKQP